MTGIQLSKLIYQILCSVDEITNIVGENIFPLIAEADTQFPFIVYKRTNITPSYTKDFLAYDIVDYEIVCVSDKYSQTIDLADLVRDTIEGLHNTQLLSSVVTYVTEDFLTDCYVQRIGFQFKVKGII